ncbi:MAG TPA: 5-deoxy-glucuronate isomerase [Chloroflexia bacterium]|nr:5-deoxy-glucuronate isomerase [Chloroflexia bacterium]
MRSFLAVVKVQLWIIWPAARKTLGYTGYYLWFLAGNHRNQNPKVDPDLAWVGKTVPMLKQLGQ